MSENRLTRSQAAAARVLIGTATPAVAVAAPKMPPLKIRLTVQGTERQRQRTPSLIVSEEEENEDEDDLPVGPLPEPSMELKLSFLEDADVFYRWYERCTTDAATSDFAKLLLDKYRADARLHNEIIANARTSEALARLSNPFLRRIEKIVYELDAVRSKLSDDAALLAEGRKLLPDDATSLDALQHLMQSIEYANMGLETRRDEIATRLVTAARNALRKQADDLQKERDELLRTGVGVFAESIPALPPPPALVPAARKRKFDDDDAPRMRQATVTAVRPGVLDAAAIEPYMQQNFQISWTREIFENNLKAFRTRVSKQQFDGYGLDVIKFKCYVLDMQGKIALECDWSPQPSSKIAFLGPRENDKLGSKYPESVLDYCEQAGLKPDSYDCKLAVAASKVFPDGYDPDFAINFTATADPGATADEALQQVFAEHASRRDEQGVPRSFMCEVGHENRVLVFIPTPVATEDPLVFEECQPFAVLTRTYVRIGTLTKLVGKDAAEALLKRDKKHENLRSAKSRDLRNVTTWASVTKEEAKEVVKAFGTFHVGDNVAENMGYLRGLSKVLGNGSALSVKRACGTELGKRLMDLKVEERKAFLDPEKLVELCKQYGVVPVAL